MRHDGESKCWCGDAAERESLCGRHYWWRHVAFGGELASEQAEDEAEAA